MLEREIRDRLAAENLDAVSLGPRFYSALRRGDWTFIRALERAPEAYSLLDETMREALEGKWLEQSPLRDQLAEQEFKHQLFRQVTNWTRRELQNLAGRYPL